MPRLPHATFTRALVLVVLGLPLMGPVCGRTKPAEAPYEILQEISAAATSASTVPATSPWDVPGAPGPVTSSAAAAPRSAMVEIGDFDAAEPFPVPLEPKLPLGSLVYDPEVSGSLVVVADADDFESGALGPQWSTSSSTVGGRIQVTGSFGTAGGDFALLMDTVSGGFTLNEATWRVDLAGQTAPRLVFSHADFNDEENLLPLEFTGSAQGDGVAISDDGVRWRTVFNATSVPFGTWQEFAIDLAAAADAAGISLDGELFVKFQQYDNVSLQSDGRGYDEIVIEVGGADADVFTIEVDPGQTITVALETDARLQAALELARDGSVLASATADEPGQDLVLQTIETPGQLLGNGPGPMTYRVTAASVAGTGGDYLLSLTLNAALEQERFAGPPNDELVSAQDLEPSFIALLRDEDADDVDDDGLEDDDDGGARPDRGAVLGSTDGTPGRVQEVEPNQPPPAGPVDLPASAQALDGAPFSLDSDGAITSSSSVPHISIDGTGDGSFDYYAFSVGSAGARGIFDIDFENFDTELFLYDSSGTLLAQNDDSSLDPGSATSLASFVDFVFPSPGTYVIGVGECCSRDAGGQIFGNAPDLGDAYVLQVSLEGKAITPSPADVFSFELWAGEFATVGLTAQQGDGLGLELIDPSGNVVASDLPSDLLENGSFETGDFSGWTVTTTGQPFRPWQVTRGGFGGGFGLSPTQPQDGSFVAWNGFDGAGPLQFTMSQDLSIPEDAARALLSWRDRVQWSFILGGFATQPRIYEVELRDPTTNALLETLFSFSTGTQATNPTGDTGWQTRQADLSAYAGSRIRLVFREQIPEFFTGPAQIEFDAIRLELGGEEGPAPRNVDRLVRDFVAQESGAHFVRVSGDVDTEYSLVVTRNSEFGLEFGEDGATETITFDGVPLGTIVDGTVIGNVTFGFSSSDASITNAGPGFSEFIAAPNIEGSTSGALTLTFAEPVSGLSYGFALSTFAPTDPGTALEIFDEAGSSLGVFSAPAGSTGFPFAEGENAASSETPIKSAVITFGTTASRFAFDNLVSVAVPEPDLDRAQTVFGLQRGEGAWLLAHVGAGASDLYRVVAGSDDDDELFVRTFTPAARGGEFANRLDPVLRLLDADGNVLAFDDGSISDGLNARIDFEADDDDDEGAEAVFFIEVSGSDRTPEGTEGEYVLRIERD